MFKDLDNLGKWELGGDISLEIWKLKVNGVSGRFFFRSLDITTPPVCRPGIQIGEMVRKGVCLLITARLTFFVFKKISGWIHSLIPSGPDLDLCHTGTTFGWSALGVPKPGVWFL